LEFCRLPGTLQVDNANLKLHHYKVFLCNYCSLTPCQRF
jgi:hypothetical protein